MENKSHSLSFTVPAGAHCFPNERKRFLFFCDLVHISLLLPTSDCAWAVVVLTLLCVFRSTQDIFKQATEDRVTSANELPYFEGDFWPNVLEESIKELEQEEEERKKEENTATCETPEVRTRLILRGQGFQSQAQQPAFVFTHLC